MEGNPTANKDVLQTVIASACTVLHITDCHLFENTRKIKNGVNPFVSLSAVLTESLAARSPDVLIASGDIAHDPTQATYRSFYELVRSHYGGHFLVTPGNHDIWRAMESIFDLGPIDVTNWTIVPLDTHREDQVSGEVSDENLMQLQRSLESANEHVIVVGHHPLHNVEVAWLDEHRVNNATEVLSILELTSQVKAYICGHVHLESLMFHGSLKLWTTPSTCWQFASDVDTFELSPLAPGWRWLELNADGSIDSRVERLSPGYPAGIA